MVMKGLKENKPLRYALGALLLVFLCCYLPQEILFLTLCMEQDREIPPNTELLVSACKKPGARGVPGGEVLFVREGRTDKMYLLDLHTGEKRKLPNDPLLLEKGVFLNPDLVWLEGSLVGPNNPDYRPHYVLDLTDGRRYELLDLDLLPSLEEDKFDPKIYSYIQNADRVYIHYSEQSLIALSADFRNSPNGRVILSQTAIRSFVDTEPGKLLEELLNDLGVPYEIVDYSLRYSGILSPTGKYIVRSDGIYFSGTTIPVVDLQYTGGRYMGGNYNVGYFRGWYYDDSAVIVKEFSDFLFTLPGSTSIYEIPRPILKLNLPKP